MVKISEQAKSPSTGKRVASDAVSKMGVELLSSSEKSAIESIERLLKAAQTLNSRRGDCVGGPLDITNNIAYPREAHPRSVTEGGSGWSDCSRQSATGVYRNERTELHLPEDTAPSTRYPSNALRRNSAKQQQQQQQPSDCHAVAAVGRQKSDVGNDSRDDDRPSFAKTAESSRAVPDSPRISGGGGESPSLCRGYSNQRRHGRKASLGTTDIKRLIPTLVSENEEFRYKEYRRKSSDSTPDGAQNLTI